jgi:hypothetical protein
LSKEQNELLAKVELGLDAQRFLNTGLGQYIQERAVTEVEDCLVKLKTIDAHDFKAIQAVQQQIAVAECMFLWLSEAMAQAAGAEHILNNQG